MALIKTICGKTPQFGKNCYLAENATIIGDVVMGGGVSLSNIDIRTLETKKHPGLFFAGEVLDVDAITGGFNLQAAWSMGYVVASTICGDASSC